MIIVGTRLKVADNSGATEVECIRIYGRNLARVGDIILISVKLTAPQSKIKRKTMHKCVIVRTKHAILRKCGTSIRFNDNAVVILDGNMNPVGKKINGPIPVEIKQKGFVKIASFAKFQV